MASQDLETLQELREHQQGGLIGGVDCDVNVAFGGPCTSTGEKALFSPVKSSGDAGVVGCSREKSKGSKVDQEPTELLENIGRRCYAVGKRHELK